MPDLKRFIKNGNYYYIKDAPTNDWTPGANTIGYWTFDDQDANQITDFSGNNNNLTGGVMPTYTLVDGTNYAGNYNNTSSGAGQSSSLGSIPSFSELIWIKPVSTGQMYFSQGVAGGQFAIIYGYKSGQIELYTYVGNTTERTTIKSGTTLNTWYMVGATFSNGTANTYLNGQFVSTITTTNTNLTSIVLGNSDGADRAKGQIGECIIEDIIWSESDYLEYYNQSKGRYLIS